MKALKIILITVASLIVLGIAGIYIAESLVEKELKKQDGLSYETFEMSFDGNLSFKNLNFKNETVEVEVNSLNLSIGLWKLISSNTILIKKTDAEGINVNLFKKKNKKETENEEGSGGRNFKLSELALSNLNFYWLEKDSSHVDTLTRALNVDLNAELDDIKDIQFDQLKSLKLDFFRQKAGVLQDIAVNGLAYKDHVVKLDTFKVFTRYSKEKYANFVPEQKDHVDLLAQDLTLDSLHFDIAENQLKKISLNEINVSTFDLEVYRDKTIPPYTKTKPTYGQMVQKLDFIIDANALIASNSRISYSMKNPDGKISRIDLKDVNATLTHIHNIEERNQNAILKGTFALSEGSVVGVDYSYNQFAKVETFQMDVHAKNIETRAVNSMLRPAVNVELSGVIKELKSQMIAQGSADGSLYIKSQDIEVDVFKKDGKERKIVSVLASTILNPPIEKNSEVENFERDETRSMWHYSWFFILEGLKKTIL